MNRYILSFFSASILILAPEALAQVPGDPCTAPAGSYVGARDSLNSEYEMMVCNGTTLQSIFVLDSTGDVSRSFLA